jgi:hypothetical protein
MHGGARGLRWAFKGILKSVEYLTGRFGIKIHARNLRRGAVFHLSLLVMSGIRESVSDE